MVLEKKLDGFLFLVKLLLKSLIMELSLLIYVFHMISSFNRLLQKIGRNDVRSRLLCCHQTCY
ncbi:hypothetical protein LCGC14_1650880 [marine sediment metagenome]|uniref:Uncharacterized protein n=1 Tax=marine sediment metagenome TaxID=412755 RepID=A0A0F9KCN1_9ZZZZ